MNRHEWKARDRKMRAWDVSERRRAAAYRGRAYYRDLPSRRDATAAKKATGSRVRIGTCGDTRTTGSGIARARGMLTLDVTRADGLTVEITSLGIDGEFPEYDRVIPRYAHENPSGGWDDLHAATQLDSAATLAAIAELAPYLNRDHVGLKLTVNGCLRLEATHPDVGTGSVEVPTLGECPEITVRVNAGYLRDALSIGPVVHLMLRDGLTQFVFQAGEWLAVVMPMRV